MLVPHEAQQKIAQSNARFKFIRCGRRFGKTEYAIENIVVNAVLGDGKVLYIAPTQKQARDIIWDKLKIRTEDFALKTNEQALEIRVKNQQGGESVIMLGSWEKVENLRGMEFIHVVLDEVREMKKAPGFFYYWKNTLKPTLLTTGGTAEFLSTPNGYDHFYELELEAKDDDEWEIFHFTSYDNPYNQKEELDKLRKKEDTSVFEQEYLAHYTKRTGLVHDSFDRNFHIVDEKHTIGEFIAGLDFGFTDPTALLDIYVHNRHWFIMDEWYEVRKTDVEVADYVMNKSYEKVYPDPANPQTIELLKQRGVNTRKVTKGKDSITYGNKLITDLFRENRIHIHKNCKNLIWELETYEINENTGEPRDANNHLIDALRYAVMTHKNKGDSLMFITQQRITSQRRGQSRSMR